MFCGLITLKRRPFSRQLEEAVGFHCDAIRNVGVTMGLMSVYLEEIHGYCPSVQVSFGNVLLREYLFSWKENRLYFYPKQDNQRRVP